MFRLTCAAVQTISTSGLRKRIRPALPLTPQNKQVPDRICQFFFSHSLSRGFSSSVESTDRKTGSKPGDSINKILIVEKVSFLDEVKRGVVERGSRMEEDGGYDRKTLRAHADNKKTTEKVKSVLEKKNAEMRVAEREPSIEDVEWADLVVTVGGDGTFLRTVHKFRDPISTPIIGVNSSPNSSFGYFCGCTKRNFEDTLDKFMEGEIKNTPLWRMVIYINDVPQFPLATNDVLFAADSAAATARYVMSNNGMKQYQKSSGVWISTAAGSTAAIKSAGGFEMPITSRCLQFRVRELFTKSVSVKHKPIYGGLCSDDFQLESRLFSGRVFIDGTIVVPVKFGDIVHLTTSQHAINWVIPEDFQDFVRDFHNEYEEEE